MDANLRRLTWVSVLQPQPGWDAKLARQSDTPHVRIIARVESDEVESQASEQHSNGLVRENAPVAKRWTRRADASAQDCQRAFNEARKSNPDALYAELSEIAAQQLRVSASTVRKRVPNPFR